MPAYLAKTLNAMTSRITEEKHMLTRLQRPRHRHRIKRKGNYAVSSGGEGLLLTVLWSWGSIGIYY